MWIIPVRRAIRLPIVRFLFVVCISTLSTRQVGADEALTFERHVRPILKARCFHCHGEGNELRGSLDLRLVRLMTKGGESGTSLVPEQPDASPVVQRIRAGEMPPKNPLPAKEIETIATWVRQGAKTARAEPDDASLADDISPEDREYWAFRPVTRPALPKDAVTSESRAVDLFLAAKFPALNPDIATAPNSAANGRRTLEFSPEADRRVLIRRASLDLLGLLPSPDDVAAFVADSEPDAWDRLLDRLLASPNYGERWGRLWLDVAGYADSEGFSETDPVRPYSYKFRDYVIRAYNSDKSFQQFLIEQLAGDELVPPPYQELTEAQQELLIATGFLRSPPDGTASGASPKEGGNALLADVVKVVSTGVMGMTVGCAQCHNHRYDPIPQSDYYRIRAVFEPAYNVVAWRNSRQRLVSLYTDADRREAAAVEEEAVCLEAARQHRQDTYIARTFEKELAKIADDKREAVRVAKLTPADKRTEEQKLLLKEHPSVNVDAGSLYLYDAAAANDLKKDAEEIEKTRKQKPKEDFINCLTEVPGQVPETRLFERGDPDQPKQPVSPGDLSVLGSVTNVSLPAKDPNLPSTGRRLAFAKHLVSGNHPLTGRVYANRIWRHLFGRGIVATPGDFGLLGERPTHPELLNWLASELVETGWSTKRLTREMMMSTAYRQSSVRTAELDAVDPDNRYLARMSVRRLDAESVRDVILQVNGAMINKQFGEPVPVMEDDVGQIVIGIENKNGENRPGPIIPMHGEDLRRSVYVQVRRTRLLGVLDTFDLPTLEPNCTARTSSTVAPQALLMMNSEFVMGAGRDMATRLEREAGSNVVNQIRIGWQLAFGREPLAEEIETARQFLAAQTAVFQKVAEREPKESQRLNPNTWALGTLCQAWLSSNEFLYVP